MTLKVDKELVFEFLLLDSDEISQEHIDEVKKVIGIVLNKYYSDRYSEFEELTAQIFTKILENRINYSPKFDAYNYVFTIARNEGGNLLKRLDKEILTDDFFSVAEKNTAPFEDDRQEFESLVLKKYAPYLSGEQEWNFLRIRQDEVAEILFFLHHGKKREVPEYLKKPGALEQLYFVLNAVLINEE